MKLENGQIKTYYREIGDFWDFPDIDAPFGLLLTAVGARRVCFVGPAEWGSPEVERFKALGEKLLLSTTPTPAPTFWYDDDKQSPSNKLTIMIRPWWKKRTVVWFHTDPALETRAIMAGKDEVDAGTVLEYPECCVKFHQRIRRIESENILRQLSLRTIQLKDVDECLLSHEFAPMEAMGGIKETHRNYPFVPHGACSDCLKDKASTTAQLNSEFSRIAKTADRQLYARFLKVARDA